MLAHKSDKDEMTKRRLKG